MSVSFYSPRFAKNVWLANHAIESMAKREITLPEVKQLIEEGSVQYKDNQHGWVYFEFISRNDNLVCAAIINEQAVIIKTMMVNWQLGEQNENSLL